jgi:hypothetical protein
VTENEHEPIDITELLLDYLTTKRRGSNIHAHAAKAVQTTKEMSERHVYLDRQGMYADLIAQVKAALREHMPPVERIGTFWRGAILGGLEEADWYAIADTLMGDYRTPEERGGAPLPEKRKRKRVPPMPDAASTTPEPTPA